MSEENTVIKLKLGRYSLRRESDKMGDEGPMFISINPETGKRQGENGEIHLGCRLRCGSISGRTFSAQDWWTTTPVTEIIEVDDSLSQVRVKTESGSIYLVESY